MDIAIENLPPYQQISNELIREAAASLSVARSALDEAKKSHVQLEQELPQAQEDDAAADALLRSEGKPKLKGRPAAQRHEKAIEEAAHEHRVAVRIEAEAFDALQAALGEHGVEWGQEVTESLGGLRGQWAAVMSDAISLHPKLVETLKIARLVLGGDQPSVGTLGFTPGQIKGLEFQSHQGRQTGHIDTATVLAGLAGLGTPPPPPQEPVKHPPLKPLYRTEGTAEQTERQAFLEHAESPEGREAAAEARRQRNEQHRRQNEDALAATLEG